MERAKPARKGTKKRKQQGTGSRNIPLSIGRILKECSLARERYESFELAYRVLQPEGKAYLRRQSEAYKKAVLDLQRLILPVVRRLCPACPHGTCCRLQSPDLKIYIARTVGGFELTDYLLARDGEKLPAPDYANNSENLCAFWDRGCRLPSAARSLLCLQYFCPSLRRELDMDLIELRLGKIRSIANGFSLVRLFK